MKSILNYLRIQFRVTVFDIKRSNIYPHIQYFTFITIIAIILGMGIILAIPDVIHGVNEEYLLQDNDNIHYLSLVPDYLRETTLKYSYEYDIPIPILVRLIYHESRWNPNAISPSNRNGTRDYGLAQINGPNINWFATAFYNGVEPFDPMNPYHAIQACARHLRYLNDIFLGDWKKAVKAYNCGIGSVQRNKIPYSTRLYADRILNSTIAIM